MTREFKSLVCYPFYPAKRRGTYRRLGHQGHRRSKCLIDTGKHGSRSQRNARLRLVEKDSFGDQLLGLNGSYGSIPAGQDLPGRWLHRMRMAGHVRCKRLVSIHENSSGREQFPLKRLAVVNGNHATYLIVLPGRLSVHSSIASA